MIRSVLAAYSEATSVPWYAWLAGVAAFVWVIWIGLRRNRQDTPGTRENLRDRIAAAEADAQVDDYRRRRAADLARERALENEADRDRDRRGLPPGQ